jgi:hypothetical protein
MRRLIVSSLLLAVCCSSVSGAPNCQSIVQIGAWNIQWLGNAAEGKRQPQAAVDIASYIAASQVDLLALAEISVTGRDAAGRPHNQPLDDAFGLLNEEGARWEYELFEKRPGARAPDDQWTGIAWNASKVQKVGGPWRLAVQVDEARENAIRNAFAKPSSDTVVLSRWPQVMKFSAGPGLSDWLVMPVHLKSNTDGAEGTARARAYEVELLLEGLQTLRQPHPDGDVIILGDSNMLSANEAAGTRLTQAGFSDCNARDLGTHLPFRRGEKAAPFDRIFVPKVQPETRNSCSPRGVGRGPLDFKVVRPRDWQDGTTNLQFRKALSDHVMVRAGMCIQRDDD